MKIIYHCHGASHSSVTAAAIHLGRLPMDRKASMHEIMALADYDQGEPWQIGTLYFKGVDRFSIPVYTLGLGANPKVAKQAIIHFLEQVGADTGELFFHEALVHINCIAKIGGALSRRYGFVKIGRPLSALGIWLQYNKLVQFVQHVQKEEQKKLNKND